MSAFSPRTAVRQAAHKLDFIVVGGSIAGLTTAFGLARSGHRVHVFEQASEIVRDGGGVRLPPNTTSPLASWGLEDEISQVASGVPACTFMDINSGEKVGYVAWSEDVVKEAGARWYALNYRQLVEILLRAALREGVSVTTNARIKSITPPAAGSAKQRPSVTLEDGRTFDAHVVIGADGTRSGVRAAIERVRPQPEPRGIVVYTGLAPIEVIDRDPELSVPEIRHGTPVWCGTYKGMICNESSPGYYAVSLFWDSAKDEPDTWDLSVPASSLAVMSASVPDYVKRLIGALKKVSRQRYDIWPAFEDWVDESGTIAVLGDAARPMAPGGNNVTSNPIESAAVFATLFSYLRGPDQIPMMLNAYEEIRRTRAEEFHQAEQIQGDIMFIPPGPKRDALRATLARGFEEGVSPEEQWNQVSHVWAYNAIDAADDWWIQWGVLRERALFADAPEATIRFDDLQISVMAH